LEAYFESLRPVLERPAVPGSPIVLNDAVIAGQAQARMLEAILALPGLSPETRAKVVNPLAWYVPQVKAPKE
jgi:hypothetical protein